MPVLIKGNWKVELSSCLRAPVQEGHVISVWNIFRIKGAKYKALVGYRVCIYGEKRFFQNFLL